MGRRGNNCWPSSPAILISGNIVRCYKHQAIWKAKVENYITGVDDTLFLFFSNSNNFKSLAVPSWTQMSFWWGDAKMTRRWPISELRSRWGLSASNLKLVSVLRNGWYNHICNWYLINSTNIHSAPVMSNMKLTIHVYDMRHQKNQVGFSNWISFVCLQSRTSNCLHQSWMTVCLCYNKHCTYFWR